MAAGMTDETQTGDGMTTAETGPIRVLIADDHSVLREGLRMVIELQPDLEVAGEAADGAEALTLARTLQPDVVLLDLMMPNLDGLAALPRLREAAPRARVVVLTSSEEEDRMVAAMRAG